MLRILIDKYKSEFFTQLYKFNSHFKGMLLFT